MPGSISGNDWLITRRRRAACRARGLDRQVRAEGRGRISPTRWMQVAKIVGVSDDHDQGAALRGRRPGRVRRARDGDPVAALLSRRHQQGREQGRGGGLPLAPPGVPAEEIATIGDQPNDVLMFKRSGLQHRDGQCLRRGQGASRRGHGRPTTTRVSPRRWSASFSVPRGSEGRHGPDASGASRSCRTRWRWRATWPNG